MNDIPQKQNEQKQIERLAAQREIYSTAKRYYFLQIVLTVIISSCFAVFCIYRSEYSSLSAMYGVLCFMIDSLFIETVIKSKKNKAAKIQELFDCDVLRIDKSPLKIEDNIVEEVLIYYHRHLKNVDNINRLKNWYPLEVGKLPIEIARLICQRSNLHWDSKLRINYSENLKYFIYILFSVVFIAGFFNRLDFTHFVLLLSGLIPVFQFCTKQYIENKEAAKRLDELLLFLGKVFSYTLNQDIKMKHLSENARMIQNEIFEHRSKSPLILDVFYRLFQKEDEIVMHRTADMLVQEAMEKLNSSKSRTVQSFRKHNSRKSKFAKEKK